MFSGFPWNLWSYSWSWFNEIVQILNPIGLYAFNSLSIVFFCSPVLLFFCGKYKYIVFSFIILLFFSFYILLDRIKSILKIVIMYLTKRQLMLR